MIVTKGYGGCYFFSMAIKGFGNWFNELSKSVSESIGVGERRMTASRTYSNGQYIRTFILSNEYEDVDRVETTWEERKTIEKK